MPLWLHYCSNQLEILYESRSDISVDDVVQCLVPVWFLCERALQTLFYEETTPENNAISDDDDEDPGFECDDVYVDE